MVSLTEGCPNIERFQSPAHSYPPFNTVFNTDITLDKFFKNNRPDHVKSLPLGSSSPSRAFASYGRGFSKPAPSKPSPHHSARPEDLHQHKLWHSTRTFIPTEPVDRKWLSKGGQGPTEAAGRGEDQQISRCQGSKFGRTKLNRAVWSAGVSVARRRAGALWE